MKRNYLEGVIDTHVHSAPDIRERKMSDFELMRSAVERKVRAIVIKSHAMPTAGRAAIMNEVRQAMFPNADFTMFGGVVLNSHVGGINPKAAEAALKVGGRIVWLPTFDSEFTMAREGRIGGIPVVRHGKITPELKTVLELIRDYGAAIATGHISPKEIFVVSEAARNLGVQNIIVNHPESNLVGLTLEEMKRLALDYGVWLEHCYQQPIGGGRYKSNAEINLRSVREIGAAHIILATDAGQKQNPWWYEELTDIIRTMEENGVSREELAQMTKVNPAMALGLAPQQDAINPEIEEKTA